MNFQLGDFFSREGEVDQELKNAGFPSVVRFFQFPSERLPGSEKSYAMPGFSEELREAPGLESTHTEFD